MRNTNPKKMSQQERLQKLHGLRDKCKLLLLGQDDPEYRSEIERWIRLVDKEIKLCLANIESGVV